MSDLLELPVSNLQGDPTTVGALTEGRWHSSSTSPAGAGSPRSTPGSRRCTRSTGDRGFTVLGVPCNQFKGQEPGTAEEIAEFCSATYGSPSR